MTEGPFRHAFEHLTQQKTFCPLQEADWYVDQICILVIKVASAAVSSLFEPWQNPEISHMTNKGVWSNGCTKLQ